MADDFKGDYGALGQVYSLPREGYLSQDLSERPTISIGTTNKVRKPFLPSGELNIPTIAAANELAQRGQLTNTDNTMRDDHVNLMTEKLSGLGMDDRKAYETSRKILGGGSIAPFGIGLADVTPMGMVYGVDEAARDFKEAEGGLETAGAIGFGLLSAAEAFPLTKVASRPLMGFLKSFNSKLPPAGARADQRLSNMASGAVLSANPIGALGDVAISTAGKVSKALTPKGIVPDRPIMPAPQRFFDKTNKDYKPFLSDFDFTEGGRYIEMNKSGLKDVTAQQPAAARISVAGDGKPSMLISKELVDTTGSPSEKGSTLVKTNLFKKKAGWKWDKVPKGFDPDPSGDFPLVSVEAKGKHHYSINADFPAGVDLSRYANSKTEPRLRPTTKGKVTLGKKVGDISVRGKKHPVYDNIIVKSAAPIAIGAGALSELPEGSE